MATATLAVGLRLDRLARLEDRIRTVTKYNPDTGEPYQKPVTDRVLVLAGRDPVPYEPRNLFARASDFWPGLKMFGASVFSAMPLADRVVGEAVAAADGDYDLAPLPDLAARLQAAAARVREALRAAKTPEDLLAEVAPYLVVVGGDDGD